MCGGKTTIQTPTPPPAPTAGDNTRDYIANLPAMYQAELEYNPKYAEQDFQLASQYYPKYAEMMRNSDQALYPETAKLQEALAKQANEGMNGAIPESMKAAYLDSLRSELGPNAGSGIGADYVSRGLLNQQKTYNDYYRDLALSVSGRQPLTSTQPVGFDQAGAGYNYGQVANNNMQGYGSYSSLYGGMYNTNAGMAQSRNQGMYGLLGAGLQTAGAFAGAGAFGLPGFGRAR